MAESNQHAAEFLFEKQLRKFLTGIEGAVSFAPYNEEGTHDEYAWRLNLPHDSEMLCRHIISLPHLWDWAFYLDVGTGDDRLMFEFIRWSRKAEKERRNKRDERRTSLDRNFYALRSARSDLIVLADELGKFVPRFGEPIQKLQTLATDAGNDLDAAISEMNISLSTVHPIVMRDTSKNIG